MKKSIKILTLALGLALLIGIGFAGFAQAPPPPPGEHELTGDQPPQGGTAPIGGGLVLLFGMGVGYVIKKVVDSRRMSGE